MAENDREIRVGILGPGNIVRRMMTDFHKARGLRITAVASRSLERARAAAAKYGAEHAFGSYEELAACDDVDLVYVAVPHHRHMECAEMCMAHGKHVLCEKPMALNDAQVRHMRRCAEANHVFLMEAMWTRFFPACEKLRALLNEGAIGDVRMITANFGYAADFSLACDSRIYDIEQGGGALLDVGVYTLSAASMIMHAAPVEKQGMCVKSPTGVDAMNAVQLRYESGAMAQLFSGVSANSDSREMVFGTDGRIVIPDFWHPTRLELTRNDGEKAIYAFPDEDEGFHHEFLHVRDCILRGLTESPVMPLAETEEIHRLMTALRADWGVHYPGEDD